MTGTAVATKEEAPREKFITMLERARPQLERVLPKHLTAERMVALARLAASRTPLLFQCDPLTVVQSVMRVSQLGLDIGTTAHLVPFRNGKTKKYECQAIPDYKGLIDLAIRSGRVVQIDSRVVYEGEEFEVEYGLEPKLIHRPRPTPENGAAGAVVAAYAVAVMVGGTRKFEWLWRKDIDKVRASSRASDNGPWVNWFEEMCKKTAVKRLYKTLPQTKEMLAAAEMDDRAETGQVGSANELLDLDVPMVVEEEAPAKGNEGLKAKLGVKKDAPADADLALDQALVGEDA